VICNLRILNSYFAGINGGGTSSVASNSKGTIRSVFSDSRIEGSGDYCAGIVSCINGSSEISDCVFAGVLEVSGRYAGGIVDYISEAHVTIRNCVNQGTILSHYSYAGARVGGICGGIQGPGTTLKLYDVTSRGDIFAQNDDYVGSLQGMCYEDTYVDYENVQVRENEKWPLIGKNGVRGNVNQQRVNTRVFSPKVSKACQDELITSLKECFQQTLGTNVRIGKAKDYGQENYVLDINGSTQKDYHFCIDTLQQCGFVKHSDNGIGGMEGLVCSTSLYREGVSVTLSHLCQHENYCEYDKYLCCRYVLCVRYWLDAGRFKWQGGSCAYGGPCW